MLSMRAALAKAAQDLGIGSGSGSPLSPARVGAIF
jgi:hypothetical protein